MDKAICRRQIHLHGGVGVAAKISSLLLSKKWRRMQTKTNQPTLLQCSSQAHAEPPLWSMIILATVRWFNCCYYQRGYLTLTPNLRHNVSPNKESTKGQICECSSADLRVFWVPCLFRRNSIPCEANRFKSASSKSASDLADLMVARSS